MLRLISDLQERILKLEAAAGRRPVRPPRIRRPIRQVASHGLSTPTDPLSRLFLGGVIGLLLGVAVALLLNRHSETVYGVPSVEAATLLPAIAEIPFINVVGKRRYDVLAQVVPASRIAEAYRGLRTTISIMWIANRSTKANAGRQASPTSRGV